MTDGVTRVWLYNLTADEWMHLANEGEDSEVAPCCGNIGQIRELLQALSACQAESDTGLRQMLGKPLLEMLAADGDGHNLNDHRMFPLLHKAITGLVHEMELGVLPCDACKDSRHGDCARAGVESSLACTCTEATHGG